MLVCAPPRVRRDVIEAALFAAARGAGVAGSAAARAFRLTVALPPPSASQGGRLTGIGYLVLVAERHRRSILCQVRLADPTAAALARATPCHLIDVITGGRLLTARSGERATPLAL